jgi:hypothetical protein
MPYDNTNTGYLKKNSNRQSERSPEYVGGINVEGREYWLSAWLKDHKPPKSGKFFSLSISKNEKSKASPGEFRPGEDDEFDPFAPES